MSASFFSHPIQSIQDNVNTAEFFGAGVLGAGTSIVAVDSAPGFGKTALGAGHVACLTTGTLGLRKTNK